jgi:hypothetical protein
MDRRGAVTFAMVLFALGCSKETSVDAGGDDGEIGAQCGEPDDPGCGVAAVCVLGYCRHGCTTDGECPQGALCLGSQPPYGCSLAKELSCSTPAQPCDTPLKCGVDGKCRFPCEENANCPRNEHLCLAGTCVSRSEPGVDETWLTCAPSHLDEVWSTGVRCDFNSTTGEMEDLSVCNVLDPGWVPVKDCNCTNEATWNWPEGSDPPPRAQFAFCRPCDANHLSHNVDCTAEHTACVRDAMCSKCIFERYVPDCEDNPAFKAISKCGCIDDSQPIPDGTGCRECIDVYSGCMAAPDNMAEHCSAYREADPMLEMACMNCLDGSDLTGCSSPEMAHELQCGCASACAPFCAAQCAAAGWN